MRTEANIEKEILAYLAENPNARDTVEGIAEWWLSKETSIASKAELEGVLVKMAAQNLVSAIKGADGRVHYGCPPGTGGKHQT
jgi:hypothetical protein